MTLSELAAGWFYLFFSFAILTYLWKLNPLYRIAEAFSVGGLLAHSLIVTYGATFENLCIFPIKAGQWQRIIPMIFGFMVFFRLTRRYAWIARYPTCILAGVGTGVLFGATFDAQILKQIGMTATMFQKIDIFSAIITLISVVTVLSYFIYTHEHRGPLGISARIGRVIAMFSFGMNFAGELIWYLTLVVGILTRWFDNAIMPLLGK